MPAPQNNPVMNQEIALKFCEVCYRAYEAWVTHKYLFDLNPDPAATIERNDVIPFFNRLSIITHEYSLQQIAKLHDPAVLNGHQNVSIDFVVKFGEWGAMESEIKAIEARLLQLWRHMKPARNKFLAHNDREAQLANEPLGGFPEGEDDLYFVALQELVNEVEKRWGDQEVYPFNSTTIGDVEQFLNVLRRSPPKRGTP